MVAASRRLLIALVAALTVTPGHADAHPIHTTLTTVRTVPVAGGKVAVELSIRAFVDDFSLAVNAAAKRTPSRDSSFIAGDAGAYLATRLRLIAPANTNVVLRYCGARRQGGVVFLCLRSEGMSRATNLRMSNALLADVHPDQVNLVQGSLDGRQASALFVRGDGFKPLR